MLATEAVGWDAEAMNFGLRLPGLKSCLRFPRNTLENYDIHVKGLVSMKQHNMPKSIFRSTQHLSDT